MAEAARAARPGANSPEYSVSELSSAIKRTLEQAYGYVRLRGEISGFRGAAASGHCYFALKDEKAKIEAVIWRGVVPGLRIKPAEGLEVIATGRITSYPGSSKYQIVIDALEPAGVGALMALLEERKKRLGGEGLFDPERKRKLPFLPRVVGIVTSPTGAVIRDMLHGFEERFPVRVLLWPVRVQGETCAAEVAAGIRGFNALAPDGPIPRPDVLIVARGGGSLEDLWGVNEEEVVRAAAQSRIPLISAVGHETDWTLIDLAADARAPTPTKAAEWAVPKHADLVEQLGKLGLRLFTAVARALEGMRVHLRAAVRGLPRRQALLDLPRQRFDAVERRLGRALTANTRAHAMRLARLSGKLSPRLVEMRVARKRARLDTLAQDAVAALHRRLAPPRRRLERAAGGLRPQGLAIRLARARERLQGVTGRLRVAAESRLVARRRHLDASAKLLMSLSYHGVLARGFALLRDADGNSVRSVETALPGTRLDVEVHDGRFSAEVLEVRSGRPPPSVPRKPARPPAKAPAEPRPGPPRDKAQSSGSGGQGSLF
ncbi:MAG: exodeoxyribonuclease VII large subunit [Hyphomicrobiaceae bacterium]|nr:exodeoxyribonuclease VII large subunit [Hyphomicrobiaceae bacterium]